MVTDKSKTTLSGSLGESACVFTNRTRMRLATPDRPAIGMTMVSNTETGRRDKVFDR